MTNEELLNELRERAESGYWLHEAALNRIEELETKLGRVNNTLKKIDETSSSHLTSAIVRAAIAEIEEGMSYGN